MPVDRSSAAILNSQVKAAEAVGHEIVQAIFRHAEGHNYRVVQGPSSIPLPRPSSSPSEGHKGPRNRQNRLTALRMGVRTNQPSAAYIADLSEGEIQGVAERARRAAAKAATAL